MSRDRDTAHLSPEIFVDVVEGVPVDASWRQHLGSCEACRSELEGLAETLSILRADVETPAPAPARTPRRRVSLGWAAVAAAVLVAGLAGYWSFLERESTSRTVEAEQELLPPIDEDAEFQLLLALWDDVDEDIWEAGSVTGADEVLFDTTRITPEERRLLVEELAEAMRSSS